MKKLVFIPLLLALLLAGCGEKGYEAVALPDGMTTDTMGERLLLLTAGSYVVEEDESSMDGDKKTVVYRVWSAEEDGELYVTVIGQDGALLEVRYQELIEHRLPLTEAGSEMRDLIWAQLLEDIGFNEAMWDQLFELAFLSAETENGFAEALIGDWTVRMTFATPENGLAYGAAITLDILSGDRTAD